MNLTFDTDLAALIQSPGFTSPITALIAQRGDGEHLQVTLTRLAEPWQAPAGAELRLIIKDELSSDADTLALADSFTYDSARGCYTADINYITTALDALFAADVNTVNAKAQFAYRTSGSAKWKRSQCVAITITRELYAGLEGSPDESEVSSDYPTLSQVIRYYAAIVGITGGGSTKLDGLATPALPLNTAVAFVDDSSSSILRIYELVTGTNAESSPTIIRPDDYATSTNERVWKLRYTAADISGITNVALKADTIRYLPAVVGVTGGGSTKLDGVATTALDAATAVAFIDDSASNTLRIYELVTGTDAEAAPDVIRPDDYNSSTNAKVWKLRSLAGGTLNTPAIYYLETTGNDATAVAGSPAKPYLTEQAAFDAALATNAPAVLRFGVGHWTTGIQQDGNWPANIMLVGAGRQVSRLAAVVCTAVAADDGTDSGSAPTDGGDGNTGRTMTLHSDATLRIDHVAANGSAGGVAGAYTAPAAAETTGATGKAGGFGGDGGALTLYDVVYGDITANGGIGAVGGQGQQGGSATGTDDAGDGGSGGTSGSGGSPGTVKLVRCIAAVSGSVEAKPGAGAAASPGGAPGVNSTDSAFNGTAGSAGSAGSAGPSGSGTSRIEQSRCDDIDISGTLLLRLSLYLTAAATTLTNEGSHDIESL